MPSSPPASPKASQIIKEPPLQVTPLALKERKQALNQIKQCDPDLLLDALVSAAIDDQDFPDIFHPKLAALQNAYKAFHDDEYERDDFKVKITNYMKKTGRELFLNEDLDPARWDEKLLFYLANELKLKIKAEYLVQLTIHQGKIIWRIVNGKGAGQSHVVYQRPHCINVNFDTENSWYMTWAQFREFKDGGKRTGSVEITKELFCDYFDDSACHQEIAAQVWQELKDRGILNARHRLSHAWRTLSNKIIALDALAPSKIISRDQIVACLKELGGPNKGKKITKEGFIAHWPPQHQTQASLIYEELQETKTINKSGYVVNLRPPIADFLTNLNLNYPKIIEAIYAIANNKDNKEIFNDQDGHKIRGAKIFRKERSSKTWADCSGLIENADRTAREYNVRPWDVAIFSELAAYEANKADEKIERDHIPAVAALNIKATELINEFDRQIEDIENTVKILEQELEKAKQTAATNMHKQRTRGIDTAIEKQFKTQLDEIAAKKETIKNLKAQKEQIELEVELDEKGHGDAWFGIAAPKEMHGTTASRGQKGKEQIADAKKQHPFIDAFNHYLKIVKKTLKEAEPAYYSIALGQCIQALGALRYMFRRMTKESKPIYGVSNAPKNKKKDAVPSARTYYMGIVPQQAFFSESKIVQEIDTLIAKEIKGLISGA